MITEKIRKLSNEYRDYTAQNLSEIVKIPSLSGKEEAVITKISQLCTEAGFDEIKTDGLGNLIARVGSGSKKLVFDAHVDTVDVGDLSQWNYDPFSGIIKDGIVHGRGTSDQKGGAASMITAGRILKELNYNGKFSVYFTFTIMEEDCDGMCWKYLIEEEGFVPDYFVSTEPTSCRLYRGHRGRMEMQAFFKGLSCHGSAPERGDNAAYKAARAALEIEKLNEKLQPDSENFLGKGTIVVSQISASGPSQCAVPDQASIYMDRRLTSGETMSQAVQQVRKAIGENKCTVEVPDYHKTSWKGKSYSQKLYFPTWKTEINHPLVKRGIKAYRDLYKKDVVVDKWTFSTNAVAVSGRHNIPSIGFGPGDENQAHAPNEFNRIEDLEICSAFYAMLPSALGNDK